MKPTTVGIGNPIYRSDAVKFRRLYTTPIGPTLREEPPESHVTVDTGTAFLTYEEPGHAVVETTTNESFATANNIIGPKETAGDGEHGIAPDPGKDKNTWVPKD